MPPFPNAALSLVPKALNVSPSAAITRTHLLALYKEQLRVAHSFSSYNFKHYFIRRTRDKFRFELPALLDGAFSQSGASTSARIATATASSSSSPSVAPTTRRSAKDENESIYAPTSSASGDVAQAVDSPEGRLREWYTTALDELVVLARSAQVNRMYEAPKLVVEGRRSKIISEGGGAGAEAGTPSPSDKDELLAPSSA